MGDRNFINACEVTTLQIPFDPLIMWMLSPALIRAWTSVVLLDPGITISVYLDFKSPLFTHLTSTSHS